MKYCCHCGKEVEDDAVICVHCGRSIASNKAANVVKMEEDKSSGLWAFLGFLIPVLGLVMYLIWKDEYPLKAKSAGQGALIGVIVSVVFSVLLGIISGAAAGCSAMYY